ncbi:MAG: amidohydrolase [Proteobacteria bacterium]|nr:amidohydrolase [Pseudomonadota bacterium]
MNNPYETLDILITGGTLLTMEPPGDIVADPVIGIRDGRIIFVEEGGATRGELPEAREVLDGSGCLVMPGLVNTHTHLPMVLFRGLADDLPLMRWLNDHIFPAEERFIDRETVYAGTQLAIAEMILSGTTTFCDGYFFESSVARAAVEAGMRGLVAQGFIDFPAPDQRSSAEKAAVAESFVEKWRGRSPLVTPALICHSPYTCSPETLRSIKAVARRTGVTFLIHLAETREEGDMIRERYGKTPVRHLADLDLLDENTIAAHCIWLDENELDLLAEHKVKVAHDPESNMKLGAGVAPVPAMLSRGIAVGLGTDGCASNNDLDLFGEMRMAAMLHKVFSADPTVMTAVKVVEMATSGGARVLGMEDRIGSVIPGKEADIILVDMKRPHLTPLYNPFSHLVYAASGADVVASIIGGRIVMKDRRLLRLNLAAIMQEVRRIGKQVVQAGFHRPASPFRSDPIQYGQSGSPQGDGPGPGLAPLNS